LHPITFGSLFSGIGGFDLGLERAGMTCKWQSEIDPFCNKVLAKHWPTVKRYGNIKEIGKHNLESVDLICGGFPCQPFSVAGKQRGSEDNRYLWPEMLRVITELNPHWIIGENVPGIIPLELDKVLSDLEGEGYETQTLIIPACAVDALHRRDRVWILGYSAEQGRQPKRGRGKEQKWKTNQFTSSSQDATNAKRIYDDSTGYGAGKDGWQQSKETKIFRNGYKWFPEPSVGRVADGVPRRVDRLRSLGNAVVPQVVEVIGRFIMKIED